MARKDSIREILGKLQAGFTEEMGRGKEDYRQSLKRGYAKQNLEADQTMWDQSMGSNRTVTLMREMLGKANPEQVRARNDMNLGLSSDTWTRRGQMAGVLASDVVQDRGRAIWWLLNAPQATVNVVQDSLLKKHAPNLFQQDPVLDKAGRRIKARNIKQLDDDIRDELVNNKILGPETLKPTAGVSVDKDGYLTKRRHDPGHTALLAIPAGAAVNTAVGLMTPLGGAEGYKAVIPDDEDPKKTSNVLLEVGSKYMLGRTGGLLNWEDFKEERPDVSKDEYMRYKAFKFDNDMDYDPRDGDLSLLPGGALKYTDEGIHGPEVQFLGKSIPATTGVIPIASALASTAYGAKGGVRRGLKYGALGTAAGMLTGNLIEGERRRRNAEDNKRDTID